MSKSKRHSNNHTGQTSSLGVVHQQTGPEILFNRRTNWEHPQEVLRYGITEAILDGETALFEVLPGVGKSRSITKIASGLKMPVTILTSLSDNYEQYSDWGAEDGVKVHKLPISDLCPTLQGEHTDDPTAQEAREAYSNGWSVSTIHREFDVPCERGDKICRYRARVDEVEPNGPDPLVGHNTQGYNPPYVNNRVVVIDEDAFDEYYEVIGYPAKAAQEFIDTLEDFPLNELKPLYRQKELRNEVLSKLRNIGLKPSDYPDSVGEFHARAPLIAYAIYGAEELNNGLRCTKLPGDRTAVFERLYETRGNGHNNGTPTMWIFDPPDFSGAEAVIGLDATPCLSKWRRVLGQGFNHYRLFGEQERNQYLREKGYEFIQLNSHAWSAQGGNLSISKCEAYLREIYREHGERPDLITGMDIRDQLEERGLDHLWNEDLYYDALRGKNRLGDSQLLVVLGAPSRGDSYYQHLTALFGESAERVEETEGMNLSFGNPIADDILDSHRRGGVFQAAMRAGREDDTEATVYIATGLVPNWLEIKKAGKQNLGGHHDACTNLRSDGMKQVIGALRGADGMPPSELYDQVDLSKDQAKVHRKALQECGVVEKEGRTRGATYYDIGLENLNIAGEVDLSLSGDFRLKNSIRGFPPNKTRPDPVIPRRDPPADPERRYPDWMRDVQRRARQRKFDEQFNQSQKTIQ